MYSRWFVFVGCWPLDWFPEFFPQFVRCLVLSWSEWAVAGFQLLFIHWSSFLRHWSADTVGKTVVLNWSYFYQVHKSKKIKAMTRSRNNESWGKRKKAFLLSWPYRSVPLNPTSTTAIPTKSMVSLWVSYYLAAQTDVGGCLRHLTWSEDLICKWNEAHCSLRINDRCSFHQFRTATQRFREF